VKHKHNVSGQPRQIRRRDALILLGGTAAAWPLGVAAQPVGMPTVGFLTTQSRDTAMPYVAAFKTGLEQSGFVEGRDVKIEYRWADGQIGRLGDLAAEIARLGAAVIFAGGGPTTAKAAAAAAPSTPIVFSTGGDPVRDGLVASLNRPGGHLTGVSLLVSELNAKRLEFLHELSWPRFLWTPHCPTEPRRKEAHERYFA